MSTMSTSLTIVNKLSNNHNLITLLSKEILSQPLEYPFTNPQYSIHAACTCLIKQAREQKRTDVINVLWDIQEWIEKQDKEDCQKVLASIINK